MNWPLLILFGIAALALIIFLVMKNQKDEKILKISLIMITIKQTNEINNPFQILHFALWQILNEEK